MDSEVAEELEAERAPLKRGDTLLGGMYTVDKLIGEGGFALTYLAFQGRWNLAVCIKEFFPYGCERSPEGIVASSPRYEHRIKEGLEAFGDEAAALSRFNHPGIVRVLGTFNENNTTYLVQEVLSGMTLADGLALAGRMKEPTVLKVAQQLGQALLMVHAAGLVHSDLKPENIFLTKEGRYVLLDFGLTRGFLSKAGAQKGARGLSSGFAPPEQYEMGDQKLTPASDVYGFAATLWTLFTGENPPDAQVRLQGQVMPAIEPLNPTITSRVERALLNALVLDQRRRTPGVREFLHQLGLDATPKSAYRPPTLELKATQKAHPLGIQALALHTGQQRLYSAGRDGVVKVWSWPTLEFLGGVPAHADPISTLTLSGRGSFLATGSETGEIKLWDTAFTSEGIVLAEQASITTRLKMCGQLIAACFADGRCCLIGTSLGEPMTWVAHAGSCNGVDFHPSGAFCVTGGSDKAVRFWNIPEPELMSEFDGHDKPVQSVQFSADGLDLLSGSSDHSVRFWDATSGKLIRELRGHSAIVLDAAFTCRPGYVATLAGDQLLRIFQVASGRVAYASEAHVERTRVMAVDPGLPLIATGGGDGEISVWEFPLS